MNQDNKETVTFEELTVSNMYEIEAMINVLIRKNIITKDEIIQEIRKAQKDIFKYIDVCLQPSKASSVLGYKTPIEYGELTNVA